jgi:tetratricopeptide (TPR) repeat protein
MEKRRVISRWFFIITFLFGCSFYVGMVAAQDSVQHLESRTEPVLFRITDKEGKQGYMDRTGKIVIPTQFEEAYAFSEDVALVKFHGKWCYIDTSGKIVIELQKELQKSFIPPFPFSEGLANVGFGGKRCFIDKTGKIVVLPKFNQTFEFSEGLARVELDSKWGFIDKTGETVIPPQFFFVDDFSEGLARVRVSFGGKMGYIDKSAKIVIELQFDQTNEFSEGLASVQIGGKWGFIDKTGQLVIQPQFNDAGNFSEELATVKIVYKWGYVDKTGKIVIPPQFDQAHNFSEGLAAVRVASKWGYIDQTGKMVIPLQFDVARSFTNGLAHAFLRSKYWGYIDKNGKFVWNSTPMEPDKPRFTKVRRDSLSLIKDVRKIVEKIEAIEAGKERGPIPDCEELAAELETYLQTHPNDVQALILSARLGRLINRTIVFIPERDTTITPDYGPFHAALDKALALQPNNSEAHYWKARLYGLRSHVYDLDQAINFARRALELEPENVAYREALTLYLIAAMKPDEAMTVMQEVNGGRHPIYLLLADLKDLPIHGDAIFLPEASEGLAQTHLESGAIRDYPYLRVRAYGLQASAAELEAFYRNHWPGFQLFEVKTEKVNSGSMRQLVQFLQNNKGLLQPVTKKNKIPQFPKTGLLLIVVEFQNVAEEEILGGELRHLAFAAQGKPFCLLQIINYRKF